ncbi:MAG: hypothetical protein VKL58_00530 [Cyanobacteriota bacterium]|nr:hypothetical protein [Cyanobacteriota bacterium]
MGSPISKETFLQRARARFATHYDYSEIVYKSYKTPILIRCQLHPVKLISITPEKHLQTSGGCKFCLRESRIRLLERELLREPAVRELPASGDPLSAPSPLASAVRPVRRGPAEGRHGLLLLLALIVGSSVRALAADNEECRVLRLQREALGTAAMEQEVALARTAQQHLCPDLAARAAGANALDGIYKPIDFGAWIRCRVEAERRLEQSHPVRYRNSQNFTFYTAEGASLARQADDLRRRWDAKGCPGT